MKEKLLSKVDRQPSEKKNAKIKHESLFIFIIVPSVNFIIHIRIQSANYNKPTFHL